MSSGVYLKVSWCPNAGIVPWYAPSFWLVCALLQQVVGLLLEVPWVQISALSLFSRVIWPNLLVLWVKVMSVYES